VGYLVRGVVVGVVALLEGSGLEFVICGVLCAGMVVALALLRPWKFAPYKLLHILIWALLLLICGAVHISTDDEDEISVWIIWSALAALVLGVVSVFLIE
jgi:hypothetical protein